MPVPDKTYAALGGWARGFQPGPEAAAFATLTQQHLAAALVQCLAGIPGAKPAADRIQVLLGSTGDGCREYDDALLLASLTAPERAAAVDASTTARWTRALERAIGRTPRGHADFFGAPRTGRGRGATSGGLASNAAASALHALGTAGRPQAGGCGLARPAALSWSGQRASSPGSAGLAQARPAGRARGRRRVRRGDLVLALKRLDDAVDCGVPAVFARVSTIDGPAVRHGTAPGDCGRLACEGAGSILSISSWGAQNSGGDNAVEWERRRRSFRRARTRLAVTVFRAHRVGGGHDPQDDQGPADARYTAGGLQRDHAGRGRARFESDAGVRDRTTAQLSTAFIAAFASFEQISFRKAFLHVTEEPTLRSIKSYRRG